MLVAAEFLKILKKSVIKISKKFTYIPESREASNFKESI
jgi:hypothetical protein